MDVYMRLSYNEYKELEMQLRNYESLETTHITTPGTFYHKSFRIKVGDLTIEFHGPAVKGGIKLPEEDE